MGGRALCSRKASRARICLQGPFLLLGMSSTWRMTVIWVCVLGWEVNLEPKQKVKEPGYWGACASSQWPVVAIFTCINKVAKSTTLGTNEQKGSLWFIMQIAHRCKQLA